jgi:putative pyoverdin transport system ATP-binding/permease protein
MKLVIAGLNLLAPLRAPSRLVISPGGSATSAAHRRTGRNVSRRNLKHELASHLAWKQKSGQATMVHEPKASADPKTGKVAAMTDSRNSDAPKPIKKKLLGAFATKLIDVVTKLLNFNLPNYREFITTQENPPHPYSKCRTQLSAISSAGECTHRRKGASPADVKQTTFLQLVRREIRGSLPKLIFMAGLSGICDAAILAAINTGASAVAKSSGVGQWAAALFIVSLVLSINAQQYMMITTTAEIEAIIHRLRLQLMDQIRRSELLAIEKIGRANVVAAITSDAAVLTQSSRTLAFAIQGIVLVFCVAIYVAYLSIVAFVLSAIVVGAGVFMFHAASGSSEETNKAAERERELFDRLIDFLDGFKEVRLNAPRSADLFNDTFEVLRAAANAQIYSLSENHKRTVSAQAAMYLALGAVVFVAPRFAASLEGGSIVMTATALLFIVGACFGLVQSMPVLMAANAAADRIAQLETKLRAAVVSADAPKARRRFERIEMRDVVFRYVDKSSDAMFQVGPLDLSLRPGDLVFVTGGNGSGKSTFMRLLAGLYPADSGLITLDGALVDDKTRDAYRSLMSAIFSDYHLFRRLYGISKPCAAEAESLLRKFRLADKTGLSNGEFRTLDLSGGQRKRLALVVSLLEKRPILLLDEWTADQDPEFRHKFYHEFLPELMQAGATVVMITHDDRYLAELDFPAYRLRMDEGRIIERSSIQTNQRDRSTTT